MGSGSAEDGVADGVTSGVRDRVGLVEGVGSSDGVGDTVAVGPGTGWPPPSPEPVTVSGLTRT